MEAIHRRAHEDSAARTLFGAAGRPPCHVYQRYRQARFPKCTQYRARLLDYLRHCMQNGVVR